MHLRMKPLVVRSLVDIVSFTLTCVLVLSLAFFLFALVSCSGPDREVVAWDPSYSGLVEVSGSGGVVLADLEASVDVGPIEAVIDVKLVVAPQPLDSLLHVKVWVTYLQGLTIHVTAEWLYMCDIAEVCIGFGEPDAGDGGLCFTVGETNVCEEPLDSGGSDGHRS